MFNYFDKTKFFLILLVRVDSFWFLFFIRQKNAEWKLCQDVIQLRQKKPKESLSLCSNGFFPSFRKFPTHSAPLYKLETVRKYGKLQIMDLNDIWHVSFLNIFAIDLYMSHQSSSSICFKFLSSNHAGYSVRLYDPVNSIFLNLSRLWLFLNLCHFLRFLKCIYCLIYLNVNCKCCLSCN